MSRLPAAYLSYTAPADYIDNVGRHTPVVRVNVHLPEEFIDRGGAKDDPPYKVQPIAPEILSEIQNQVLRQTSGTARQFLGAFRQGRDLGNLNIVGRSCILADGIGMSYTSQFGMELVNINVTPEAVRRLIGEIGGGLYLLVLYSGNKIAAFNMSNIEKSEPSLSAAVYEKTLSKSSWSTDQSMFSQIAPLEKTTTIFAPFHFDLQSSKVTGVTGKAFFKGDFSTFNQTSTDANGTAAMQVLVSEGKVCCPNDIFEVKKTEVKRTAPPTGWSDGAQYGPIYITKAGDYICDSYSVKTVSTVGYDDVFSDWQDSPDGPYWILTDASSNQRLLTCFQTYNGFHQNGEKYFKAVYLEKFDFAYSSSTDIDIPLIDESPNTKKLSKHISADVTSTLIDQQTTNERIEYLPYTTTYPDLPADTYRTRSVIVDTGSTNGTINEWLVKDSVFFTKDQQTGTTINGKYYGSDYHSTDTAISTTQAYYAVDAVEVSSVGPTNTDKRFQSKSYVDTHSGTQFYCDGGSTTYYLRDGGWTIYALKYTGTPPVCEIDPDNYDTVTLGQSYFFQNILPGTSFTRKSESQLMFTWPPCYKEKPWVTTERGIYPNINRALLTPFGEEIAMPANKEPWPWFHISNGKTIMQGFSARDLSTQVRSDHRIWVNGKRFENDLKNALDINDIKDIQLILLDIKLDDIKKLA